MKKNFLAGLVIALAGAFSSASAFALPIFSNLPVNGGGGASVDSFGLNAAMGFTMPSTDYSLNSVTLSLEIAAGVNPLVRLYSDSGSNPALPLLTLVNPGSFSGIGSYIFDAPGSFTLAADVSYWIVLDTLDSSYRWLRNSPVSYPTGEATYLGTRFNGNPPTSNADSFAYGIEIDATALANPVPVPATLVLFGLGLAGLGWSMRRKS